MLNCDTVKLMQAGGLYPKVLASGNAPGESGVSVLHTNFYGGAFLGGTAPTHLIYFHMSPATRFDCTIGNEVLSHDVGHRFLVIVPAHADWTAHSNSNIANLLISVKPGILSLAAAEEGCCGAELTPWVRGEDLKLWDLARLLAAESEGGYRNGALYWNDVAAHFVAGVLARHTSRPAKPCRREFNQSVLINLRAYIDAHLHEPIDVAALANVAGCSPFHFSRVFTRSVGVTPHRYVVYLRLKRALMLIHGGRDSFAEIAVQTGFADQSHLSRWFRRVHGVTMRQAVP